jgi:hypothetical protein
MEELQLAGAGKRLQEFVDTVTYAVTAFHIYVLMDVR